MGRRHYWKLAAIIYALGLHLILAALIVDRDFIAKVQARLSGPPTSPSEYFRRMIEVHAWMDELVPDDAIVFLGDSITQGLATAAVAPHSVNYGISGQNTVELLDALQIYKSLARSRGIVLTIGINDIGQGLRDGLHERLKKVNAALPQKQHLVWNAIMPANGRQEFQRAIKEANATIKSLCGNRPNCTYIDTWAFLADKNGQIIQHLFIDGLHLSSEGYRAWIGALIQATGSFRPAQNPGAAHPDTVAR